MPTRGENDEERFNRIASLMEEYRVKHEDLMAYVDAVRVQTTRDRADSRTRSRTAREGLKRARARRTR